LSKNKDESNDSMKYLKFNNQTNMNNKKYKSFIQTNYDISDIEKQTYTKIDNLYKKYNP